MYVNKCTKCGAEFETKNPKRVICPNCLYPDKKSGEGDEQKSSLTNGDEPREQLQSYSFEPQTSSNAYSPERPNSYRNDGWQRSERNEYQNREYNRNEQGGYAPRRPQGGYYDRNQGGQNRSGGYQDRNQGGYNRGGNYQDRGQGGYNRAGGYQDRQGGYNRGGNYQDRNQNRYNRPQGGHNRLQGNRPSNGRFPNNRRPARPNRAPKVLLVSREQLEQIELLYKTMLPLPNPDAHEVIGAKIDLEPKKVFFGINLVRQKMMLPKLPFPKRKLAITPDQMMAIRNLYEPLLPVPPIGCHKIIAAQLKMDEWRVHVGIGLVRAQMGFERWNQDRPDAPEEFKKKADESDSANKKSKTTKSKSDDAEKVTAKSKTKKVKVADAAESQEEVKPKKRATKKKADTTEENE